MKQNDENEDIQETPVRAIKNQILKRLKNEFSKIFIR